MIKKNILIANTYIWVGLNMDKYSKIVVNLEAGEFSVKGSEEFVEKMVKEIISLLKSPATRDLTKTSYKKVGHVTTKSDSNQLEKNKQDQTRYFKYVSGGVISVDERDRQVHILRKIPGKNNAQKARNIALIVAYCLNNYADKEQLINLCEKNKCMDAPNFKTWFKKDTSNFIIREESSAKWKIEITINGEKAAEKLLDKMLEIKLNS